MDDDVRVGGVEFSVIFLGNFLFDCVYNDMYLKISE
jgi:hypothetical protein